MNVKKLIAITTMCAAMLCTGTYITASADADAGITIPDSFTVEITDALTSVNDYAVGDSRFAFADGNTIYIFTADESSGLNYSGGLATYAHSSAVTTLEYSDGTLYFSDGTSAYSYSNGSATSASFTFTAFSDSARLDADDYLYYINGSSLVIFNYGTTLSATLNDAVYTGLKKIGSSYYVLKDNTLCTISDGVLSEMSFSYEDYNIVNAISTGDTSTALSGLTTVQTATVAKDACIIRVDEDYLSEKSFTVLSITLAEDDMAVQVLYSPDGGNAALIAAGTKTYLTLKTNLTVSAYSPSAVASETTSYYLLDDASVYSVPYENECTVVAEAAKNTVVTVTGYVSGDVFDYDYYKVEYTADGEKVSGYMVAELLTTYTFANDNVEETVIAGGDQSDENNNLAIILVMVIVVLVLIAVGYVTFVATSDKKKRNKRK